MPERRPSVMPTVMSSKFGERRSLSRLNEAELVARAQAGDIRAFTQLVTDHDHSMRGLAYSLLGSHTAMDDSLQEAYIKAYNGLAGFRHHASFGTWLYRIVYRSCLDQLRTRSRHSEVSLDMAHDAPDRSISIDDQIATTDQVLRALNTLTVGQRATVLLVDRDGLSYEEAAVVLDTTVGTIASRLSRAHEALRNAVVKTEDSDQ